MNIRRATGGIAEVCSTDNCAELWILRPDAQDHWLARWQSEEDSRRKRRIQVWLGQSREDPGLWTVLMSGTEQALAQYAADSVPLRDGAGCRLLERRRQRVWSDPGMVQSGYAAAVRQRVESFDRWWAVFCELEPLRSGAGIVGVRVGRSPQDEREVHLYAFVSDPERYAALVRSDELRTRLRAGGLVGSPEVVMVQHAAPACGGGAG